MPQGKAGRVFNLKLMIGVIAVATALAVFVLCANTPAFAAFSSESAEQVIGVGRIQSSAVATPSEPEATTRFAAPKTLATPPTQETTQLAQPLDRGHEDVDEAVAKINEIKRFGEPDSDGWFSTLASAYGPSSNTGTSTAMGTEVSLTSMDVAITMAFVDLMGRTIQIKYGEVVLTVRIVDCGYGGGAHRLFDLQPGICTAFGAPTPEFGWGVRTIQWRFADQ